MEHIELEVAIKELIKYVKPQLSTKCVPIVNSLNHYIADDILAPIDVPNYNKSAMDGYAVKSIRTKGASNESPIRLPVISQILAGDAYKDHYDGYGAVRIMTGAFIPQGYDAVICQEDTNYGEEEVEIYKYIPPYTNYGKIGEDIKKDKLIIKKSTLLTPVHIGILSSVGIEYINIMSPLKVGLISSGSELVQVGSSLNQGQIYDSNLYMLEARLKELQVDVVFKKQIIDEVSNACKVILQALEEVDILITTGGVSVGKKDIMHDVMKEIGAKRLFWKIKMRPGTPVLGSLYGDKLILSLSGNPFAALTTFELLFNPMLSKFMQASSKTQVRQAVLMDTFDKASSQRRFVRGFYEDGKVFLPTTLHESSVLSSMIGCNCLIDIPALSPSLEAGKEVKVILL